jgi:large subunit ribosomal protein L21
MFAVIKTGGKQHRVAANDVIAIERRAGAPGDAVTFDEVLMLTGADGIQVGAPTIAGATVCAEIVEQTRGPKVIAFKKRRRKNSRRKRGHRQDLTVVRITRIGPEGSQAQAEAAPVEATRGTAAAAETAERATGEVPPAVPEAAAAPTT